MLRRPQARPKIAAAAGELPSLSNGDTVALASFGKGMIEQLFVNAVPQPDRTAAAPIPDSG